MKPASAWDDETFDTTADDDWTITETTYDGATIGTGTNLCKETWVLSNTSAACVKTVGGASRLFVTDDADGEDIELELDVVYAITTEFGWESDGTANNQFSAVNVDFANFRASETTGAVKLFPSAMLAMSALTFLASFF